MHSTLHNYLQVHPQPLPPLPSPRLACTSTPDLSSAYKRPTLATPTNMRYGGGRGGRAGGWQSRRWQSRRGGRAGGVAEQERGAGVLKELPATHPPSAHGRREMHLSPPPPHIPTRACLCDGECEAVPVDDPSHYPYAIHRGVAQRRKGAAPTLFCHGRRDGGRYVCAGRSSCCSGHKQAG